jgi:hypothetical protein
MKAHETNPITPTPDQPDTKTTRSLTLLAKCLMSLANLVDPSLKEPWMSFLHQFIMVSSDLDVIPQLIPSLTYVVT